MLVGRELECVCGVSLVAGARTSMRSSPSAPSSSKSAGASAAVGISSGGGASHAAAVVASGVGVDCQPPRGENHSPSGVGASTRSIGTWGRAVDAIAVATLSSLSSRLCCARCVASTTSSLKSSSLSRTPSRPPPEAEPPASCTTTYGSLERLRSAATSSDASTTRTDSAPLCWSRGPSPRGIATAAHETTKLSVPCGTPLKLHLVSSSWSCSRRASRESSSIPRLSSNEMAS